MTFQPVSPLRADVVIEWFKMKLPHRRQFLHLAAGAAALPVAARLAKAQTYPVRPVRVIVPFGPAGGTAIGTYA